MRVLVLTTAPRYTPDVQLLLHLAAALSARGDVVALACVQGSAVNREVSVSGRVLHSGRSAPSDRLDTHRLCERWLALCDPM